MNLEVDLNVMELLCECTQCPMEIGCFSFRVYSNEFKKENISSYICPRGHKLNDISFVASLKIDTHGYTIDRNHPLWITNPS